MASNHLRLVVNNPPVEPSVETSTKKQKVTPVERQHDRIKELAGSLGHGDHGDDLWTVRAISRACERLENLLLAPIIKERATQCLDCIPNLRDHERTFLCTCPGDPPSQGLTEKQARWLDCLSRRLTPEGAEEHRQYLSERALT
jgi:hypothetical protein